MTWEVVTGEVAASFGGWSSFWNYRLGRISVSAWGLSRGLGPISASGCMTSIIFGTMSSLNGNIPVPWKPFNSCTYGIRAVPRHVEYGTDPFLRHLDESIQFHSYDIWSSVTYTMFCLMVVRHCYVVVTLKIHLIHLKIFQGLQTHMAWMIVQNYQDSAWGFVYIEVIQPCQEEIFIYVPWLAHCHYRAWRQAFLKFWVFPNTFKNDNWRDEFTGCVTTCSSLSALVIATTFHFPFWHTILEGLLLSGKPHSSIKDTL